MVILGIHIGAVFEQQSDDLRVGAEIRVGISVGHGAVQRSIHPVVPGGHIRPSRQQQPNYLRAGAAGGMVQGRGALLIPGGHVRAGIQQQPDDLRVKITVTGRYMQSSPTEIVPGRHIRPVLQ